MKVCILSKGGGGGGQTPNPNFLDFILVELVNRVTEKFNPIFGPNFRGGGGVSEKLLTKYILSFFKLRLGASRTRSVGRSVCLSVCLIRLLGY